jgi:hypothetical protein
MYQLEAGASKQVESGLRVPTVNQPVRAPFGQPFVIESRDRVEPAPALIEGFAPERSERLIALNHDLGMKRDCF